MSKITHSIELRPPKSAGGKEHLTVGPFICLYCGGRGYFMGSWFNRDASQKPAPTAKAPARLSQTYTSNGNHISKTNETQTSTN